MKLVFWYGIISTLALLRAFNLSTVDIQVVEISSTGSFTFVCNVPSTTTLTRWTYLAGYTGTLLMSYQNGQCTVSPSDSFINDRYSYNCNSTVHEITNTDLYVSLLNNHILACRDAVQPDDGTGSTWKIRVVSDGERCNCDQTHVFNVREITEEDDVTFICKVSSDVPYVNWNRNIGSDTAAMGSQNGQCTTPGTTFLDNTSKYIYTCNNTVYTVTILNVHRSEHNDVYMCTPVNHTEGKGSNWILKVKASVTSVTMTPQPLVNVTENTEVEFTCTTSTARPAASVYWYRHTNGNYSDFARITENITTTTDYNDISVTTSSLRFVPKRQDNNTNVFCKANNSVNTGAMKPNMKRLLNVVYKAQDPYIIQGSEYRVIENTPVTLSCSVKGGNPTPTPSWSCNELSPTNQSTINSDGNVTTRLTWTSLRTHEGTCTCTSQQPGFRETSTNVSLIVLYPPSKPVFTVNGNTVDGDVYFIEGNSRRINCTAYSKPPPDIYKWSGSKISSFVDKQTLLLATVQKEDAGQYTCRVNNTMNPSNGGNVTGINSSYVIVNVLYSPVVLPMDAMSKVKDEELRLPCNYTAGMPETTSVKWTRANDNKEWNTSLLSINSLGKSDAGMYTCTANNTMKQSGDSKFYIGQHNQSFYLDVQYAASITSFHIDGFINKTVTVNESGLVRFICNTDSNPPAGMTLSHDSITLKNVTSNNIEYIIADASCQDTGTYNCSALNKHNDDKEVYNDLQLFVNCSPRVGEEVDVNITSERDRTATIVFIVIAYPLPTFTWFKLVDGNWTSLHDSDHNVIKSANLQSNLTIHSVGMDDFTRYKVVVENELGQMEQTYTLSPYDKPDPPTRLRHIEGRTTTSSIHIEWEPGFDNGPSQTFHIKYKKSSDTVWNYLNVSDNGEPTMNITLTGLLENTHYEVIIFASNVKGNSSESDVLIIRTKAIPNSPSIPGALIGGIAGGVTGCIVIVIVILFIIRRYPLFKGNGTDGQNIRRSVSDDSDDEDGLVDNPMYGSSSNVAPVTSTSASTSTDIYSKPVKPNKTNVAGNGDIYSVVNKTKGQGKGGKGKSTNEKGKQKEGDVYENVKLENAPNKKDAGRQLPPKPLAKQPKLTIVNQDGLIYADLVFKDKPPGVKMVIIGDDSTPYDLVDFTRKADPLPESDEEEQK